jgi:6-phosphogluconate dehydrogenase
MAHQALCDIGLIGLAVMGQNLVLNMDDHGFRVAVFNRTRSKTDEFMTGSANGRMIQAAGSFPELVGLLQRPRRIMLMVKAGAAVDASIEALLPLLEPGDIIIDGGNSNYKDSIRHAQSIEAKGQLFVGMGVSGGEEGARHGPSIMPGGSPAAWPYIKDMFQCIAAKVEDGSPCCEWVGENGAGHFVKMVHNGIEYGDMQLIAEAYHLMKAGLGLGNEEMAQIFDDWSQGELGSYLIEITRNIVSTRDSHGGFLVDKILDTAGQKGTGRWAVDVALELGVPLTLVSEAVFARTISALKDERSQASAVLGNAIGRYSGDPNDFVEDIRQGLYASKITSYAQGFMLLRTAAQEYNWDLNYGAIASLWRGGCIIRSVFLDKIRKAFDADPRLPNLFLDPFFSSEIRRSLNSWRHVVAQAVSLGLPIPALSSALAFFDGYRLSQLPANLIQAQRDYFGAHTYERVDQPRGEYFHTAWGGRGSRATEG